MILYLDFETHSTIPIRRGNDAYFEGGTPLVATWAVDDGPIQLHDFVSNRQVPYPLYALIDQAASEIWAHKADFDRGVVGRLLKIPTDIARWRCSMVLALSHGLPGGLEPLGTVLGVPQDEAKIADGKRLIQKFCKGPLPDGRDPEWELFLDYAKHDISAMRHCIKTAPKWNYQGEELRLWHVDQEINNRGFAVDTQLAENAILALKKEKDKLDDAIWIQTCGSVTAATQRDKLLLYLCEQEGCILADLRAPTIQEALDDESISETTKALLRIRLAAAKTSTSKYKRTLESTGKGGRLRGTLQFAGASRTARWAGRIFQPQNLPRPTMRLSDIRYVIDLIRSGHPEAVSLFAPIGEACMNALRGLIIASPNSTLMVSDYSAIEARTLAWLAGEQWKLDAFKNNERLYCRIYERAFGLPIGSINKKTHPAEDQLGKVMDLSGGYGGGVGAFLNMAAVYNLDLEELGRTVTPEQKSIDAWQRALIAGETFGLSREVYTACDTLKLRYRKANPEIVKLWYQLEDAARTVILAKDPALKIHVGHLTFDCSETVMRIKLPSGRFLMYWFPKILKRKRRGIIRDYDAEQEFDSRGEISYMSWRNKSWVRTHWYGGKGAEQVSQGVSRDFLAFALLNFHDAGFPIVLHIHDEAIGDVPNKLGLTFEQFNTIMQTRPKWAAGFPLSAEGYSGTRYEKR